jgi:hypothetical protein
LITHRLAQGQRPCSAETGAYCQARKRLPEKFFSAVACLVGRALDAKAKEDTAKVAGRPTLHFESIDEALAKADRLVEAERPKTACRPSTR